MIYSFNFLSIKKVMKNETKQTSIPVALESAWAVSKHRVRKRKSTSIRSYRCRRHISIFDNELLSYSFRWSTRRFTAFKHSTSSSRNSRAYPKHKKKTQTIHSSRIIITFRLSVIARSSTRLRESIVVADCVDRSSSATDAVNWAESRSICFWAWRYRLFNVSYGTYHERKVAWKEKTNNIYFNRCVFQYTYII